MPTRRDALGFLAKGSGFLALSSCTKSISSQPVILDSYFDSGQGRQAMRNAVDATELSSAVEIGATSRSAFESSIDGYLTARPGAAFTWASSASLVELMESGRLRHVSDVWVNGDLNPRLRRISSDSQGTPYFVPFTLNPWAIYYSRRMFADGGYQVPQSVEDLVALADRLASDGVAAFGLGRLATRALLGLFDYLNLAVNGVRRHRKLLVGELSLESPELEPVLAGLGRLVEIEAPLGDTAAVALVPSQLSDADTREDPEGDIDCFALGSAVVSAVEGFVLAPGLTTSATNRAITLLGQLSEIAPQNAFIGSRSLLPASPNANYRAMGDSMLKAVELVEAATDVVESVAQSNSATVADIRQRLSAIVRP